MRSLRVGVLSLVSVLCASQAAMASPGDTLIPIEETPSPPCEARETPEAPAPTPSAKPAAAAPPHDLDYRWKLAVADLSALGLVLAAIPSPEVLQAPFAYTALGVYALGGPTIHLVHGQRGRALASVGMRLGFPVVGALPGVAILSSCGSGESEMADSDLGCLIGGALITVLGVGVGGVTAVIIDDAVLGKVPRHELAEETKVGSAAVRIGAAPLLDPVRKTYGLSLSGSF